MEEDELIDVDIDIELGKRTFYFTMKVTPFEKLKIESDLTKIIMSNVINEQLIENTLVLKNLRGVGLLSKNKEYSRIDLKRKGQLP